MSLRRLNALLMDDILPFNWGYTHETWCRLWDEHPDMREGLVGSNPHEWLPEMIEEVNRNAAEEVALYERLMALPDEEFRSECLRIRKDRGDEIWA